MCFQSDQLLRRMTLKSTRIKIWRFGDAPKALQSMHSQEQTPHWLMLAPRSSYRSDLNDFLMAQGGPGTVWRYETLDGDVVYTGSGKKSSLINTVYA